jgi:hypothetical protein
MGFHRIGTVVKYPGPHDLPAFVIHQCFRCKIRIVIPGHATEQIRMKPVISVFSDVVLAAFVVADEKQKMLVARFSAISGRG